MMELVAMSLAAFCCCAAQRLAYEMVHAYRAHDPWLFDGYDFVLQALVHVR